MRCRMQASAAGRWQRVGSGTHRRLWNIQQRLDFFRPSDSLSTTSSPHFTTFLARSFSVRAASPPRDAMAETFDCKQATSKM